MLTPGAALRRLMSAGAGAVPIPGALNGLVARAAADVGFPALYVSGGAISAASGVPDVGLVTRDRFTAVIREITSVASLPVLADADTGFGEIEGVTQTVHDYLKAGAAGLHIEDQVFPKKCGHLAGKALVPSSEFCAKVSAAVAARNASSDPDFIVCARTDARGVTSIQDAVNRAVDYVAAGGRAPFSRQLFYSLVFILLVAVFSRDT